MLVLTEYKAVQGATITELNTAANAAITEGFTPNSGISVCMCGTADDSEMMYTQTMVKYEEEE